MRSSDRNTLVSILACMLLMAGCGGGSESSTRDTITAASPGSGTYGSGQAVTLTSNEPHGIAAACARLFIIDA